MKRLSFLAVFMLISVITFAQQALWGSQNIIAAYGHCVIREDGNYYEHPHWFELAKDKWAQVYKTTGTPCSCWMCRGFEYDREEYKKETLRMIRESME